MDKKKTTKMVTETTVDDEKKNLNLYKINGKIPETLSIDSIYLTCKSIHNEIIDQRSNGHRSSRCHSYYTIREKINDLLNLADLSND